MTDLAFDHSVGKTHIMSLSSSLRPSNIRNVTSIIVFDIGGTWFRSGIFTSDNELAAVSRRPAINYKNNPNEPAIFLQEALVDYVVTETHRLRADYSNEEPNLVGISMGAAVNAHTGLILNSGPLWGPECLPFDLLASLRRRDPSIEWTIVNDITASLLCHSLIYEQDITLKLMLVTVSTGIGCRVYDTRLQTVPVDPVYGLQGEIGHIPVAFQYKGTPIELRCDCGGLNHLNAFSSGRGIEALIRSVAILYSQDFKDSLLYTATKGDLKHALFDHFAEAVKQEDHFAIDILNASILPLAQILINLFTLDPEVQRVILVGGVVHKFGERYIDSLLDHLNRIGLYQISLQDPLFFNKRIRLGSLNDNSGLIGAAISAKLQTTSSLVNVGDEIGRGLVEYRSNAGSVQWSVQAHLPLRYEIAESADLFAPINRDILWGGSSLDSLSRRRMVVIDSRVEELYGDRIQTYFRYQGIDCSFLSLAISEQEKNMDLVHRILKDMDVLGIPRRCAPVIAIGGGVLLDTVGLAVSVFRRGIPYIRIPTTLLSLIDASIGVKVGVNFLKHKNRVGAYYPPLAVLLDKTFLRTLDERQISNGISEIIKIAIVKDRDLFELLERNVNLLIAEKFQDMNVSHLVIRRAIQSMLEELATNLWERRLERLVDFGHSFSPGIEMKALPELLHGEAVAIDMALSCVVANKRGLLSSTDLHRVLSLIKTSNLPITHSVCEPEVLYKALQDTVLQRDGLQRLPLPVGIGVARFFNDVEFDEIEAAVDVLSQYP